MFPTVLYILLYTFLGLFALSIIVQHIPSLGDAIAFACTVIGKPFVMLEHLCKEWQVWPHGIFKNTLEKIKRNIVDHSSVGRVIFSRILWVLVATILLCSETFNALAAVPPLFHIGYIALPDWLVITSAALFLLVPLSFGAILLEMAGAIPFNERLFPPLHRILRVVFAVYSFVGLVLSIVVIYYFFLFRAIYIDLTLRKSILPLELSNVSLIIFGGLGIELAAAAPVLWFVIPAGLEVLLGILLTGLLSFLLNVFSFLFSLFPRFLEVISINLSHRPFSPYNTVPAPVQFKRGEITLLSSPKQLDVIDPVPENKGETMIGTKQYASLVFGGSFGTLAYTPFVNRFNSPRFQDVVLTHALLDLDHEPRQQGRIRGDISPSDTERHTLVSRMKERRYSILFEEIGKRQVERHTQYKGTDACFVYVLDCHVIHHAEDMLKHVHAHLRDHKLIVCTSFSARDLEDTNVVNNLQLLMTLYQQEVLATTIVIDPTSPFVLEGKHSKDTQLEFAANAIIGLLSAPKFSFGEWTNKSSVRLITELARSFPLLSLSFDSDFVKVGDPLFGWGWLRFFTKKAGLGDLEHAQRQAEIITEKVISSERNDTRAFLDPVKLSNDAILLCHVPLSPGQKFVTFSKEYQRGFEDTYAHFSVVTISGNGTPYPEKPHHALWLQVTCFYPLIRVFDKERAIESAKTPLSVSAPTLQEDEQRGKEHEGKQEAGTEDKAKTPGLTPVPVDEHQNKENGTNVSLERKDSPDKQEALSEENKGE